MSFNDNNYFPPPGHWFDPSTTNMDMNNIDPALFVPFVPFDDFTLPCFPNAGNEGMDQADTQDTGFDQLVNSGSDNCMASDPNEQPTIPDADKQLVLYNPNKRMTSDGDTQSTISDADKQLVLYDPNIHTAPDADKQLVLYDPKNIKQSGNNNESATGPGVVEAVATKFAGEDLFEGAYDLPDIDYDFIDAPANGHEQNYESAQCNTHQVAAQGQGNVQSAPSFPSYHATASQNMNGVNALAPFGVMNDMHLVAAQGQGNAQVLLNTPIGHANTTQLPVFANAHQPVPQGNGNAQSMPNPIHVQAATHQIPTDGSVSLQGLSRPDFTEYLNNQLNMTGQYAPVPAGQNLQGYMPYLAFQQPSMAGGVAPFHAAHVVQGIAYPGNPQQQFLLGQVASTGPIVQGHVPNATPQQGSMIGTVAPVLASQGVQGKRKRKTSDCSGDDDAQQPKKAKRQSTQSSPGSSGIREAVEQILARGFPRHVSGELTPELRVIPTQPGMEGLFAHYNLDPNGAAELPSQQIPVAQLHTTTDQGVAANPNATAGGQGNPVSIGQDGFQTAQAHQNDGSLSAADKVDEDTVTANQLQTNASNQESHTVPETALQDDHTDQIFESLFVDTVECDPEETTVDAQGGIQDAVQPGDHQPTDFDHMNAQHQAIAAEPLQIPPDVHAEELIDPQTISAQIPDLTWKLETMGDIREEIYEEVPPDADQVGLRFSRETFLTQLAYIQDKLRRLHCRGKQRAVFISALSYIYDMGFRQKEPKPFKWDHGVYVKEGELYVAIYLDFKNDIYNMLLDSKGWFCEVVLRLLIKECYIKTPFVSRLLFVEKCMGKVQGILLEYKRPKDDNVSQKRAHAHATYKIMRQVLEKDESGLDLVFHGHQ